PRGVCRWRDHRFADGRFEQERDCAARVRVGRSDFVECGTVVGTGRWRLEPEGDGAGGHSVWHRDQHPTILLRCRPEASNKNGSSKGTQPLITFVSHFFQDLTSTSHSIRQDGLPVTPSKSIRGT